MRKLLVLLGFVCFIVLISCHNRTHSHRGAYSGPNKNSNIKQKETFLNDENKSGSNKFKPTKTYDKKKHRMIEQKSFLSSPKDKHDRQNSSYDTKLKETKGSYEYNSKKKRVTKKKFLFFKRYKREKETSTFTGGKVKKFFKFNIFNKKKRENVHRHGLFRRRTEKKYKRKKLEQDLFDPRMRVIV